MVVCNPMPAAAWLPAPPGACGRRGRPYADRSRPSIDLTGLHMASDTQFNRKSCTTGHRLRRPVCQLAGPLRRAPFCRPSPALYGSLCHRDAGRSYVHHRAAGKPGGPGARPRRKYLSGRRLRLAQELPEDQILVVSETEYTGAGKHVQPQLDFARENGIEVRFGKPGEEVPGVQRDPARRSLSVPGQGSGSGQDAPFPHQDGAKDLYGHPTEADYEFLAQETNKSVDWVREQVAAIVLTL